MSPCLVKPPSCLNVLRYRVLLAVTYESLAQIILSDGVCICVSTESEPTETPWIPRSSNLSTSMAARSNVCLFVNIPIFWVYWPTWHVVSRPGGVMPSNRHIGRFGYTLKYIVQRKISGNIHMIRLQHVKHM